LAFRGFEWKLQSCCSSFREKMIMGLEILSCLTLGVAQMDSKTHYKLPSAIFGKGTLDA
jgi:hypothetical protein